MKKQIEEMARDICGLNTSDGCFCDGGYCNYNCLSYEKAEALYNAGYRKQSEWISVEDDLPKEGEDVQIWIGSTKSARIRKGITEEERQKMRNGELPNPQNVYWCISQGDTLIERSEIYTSADVHGNNLVPYCWELDGGNTLFGQYVKYWKHQPQPPEMKGGAE